MNEIGSIGKVQSGSIGFNRVQSGSIGFPSEVVGRFFVPSQNVSQIFSPFSFSPDLRKKNVRLKKKMRLEYSTILSSTKVETFGKKSGPNLFAFKDSFFFPKKFI